MKRLDKDNFESFILENSVLFYYFASKYASNKYLIEDILQDCYVKLWDMMDNAGQIEDAKLYMFAMIKNAALNSNKKEKKTEPVKEFDEGRDIGFLNDIFDAEASSIIAKSINSLPKRYVRILVLSLKGYKNNQIAKMLEISEDAVKSQKKRAMKKLSLIYKKLTILVLGMNV
jgi:RNA polymerase sigma factor (sigma-70 family)